KNNKDNKIINEWLSELCDELKTSKLSLQYLLNITESNDDNIKSKIEEFHTIATKCDMYSLLEIPNNVLHEIELSNHIIQKNVTNYKILLNEIKNRMHELIMIILQ